MGKSGGSLPDASLGMTLATLEGEAGYRRVEEHQAAQRF